MSTPLAPRSAPQEKKVVDPSYDQLREMLGVTGGGPKAVEQMKAKIDRTLASDQLLQHLQESLKKKNASAPDVAHLRTYLEGIRNNADLNLRMQQKAEKKGIGGRILDGLKSTGSFLWRHKWAILITAAVAYFGYPYVQHLIAGLGHQASATVATHQIINGVNASNLAAGTPGIGTLDSAVRMTSEAAEGVLLK